MKTLTIIRHAKSSWNSPTLSDHDRPLNDRGERDAPKMGQALKERDVLPDVIHSSTANRAISTAQIIADEIGFPKESIVETQEIYLAATSTLLHVVNQIDENHDSAMLFGHNPGFHDLSNTLIGNNKIEHFPTCCVARLKIDVETWGEIGIGDAELEELLFPRMLPG